MTTPFDSEIRAALAGALGTAADAQKIHLPARYADASVHPPRGADSERAPGVRFGSLYGAPLVETVRVQNGWLLFTFSPAFYDALTMQINALLPLPASDGGSHAVNRMLVLARHGGSGCPDHPAFRRALLLAVCAHESRAAYLRAERAARTLFHTIPPRERAALLPLCGAFGGALARLLFSAARPADADLLL